MKTIAQNEYYTILVDSKKNRLYLTVEGFWKNRSVVPHYIDDLKKAIEDLNKGFTLLTDVRRMKVPPAEIAALHNEAQTLVISEGLGKTAEIHGEDVIAKMAVDRYSSGSGMFKRNFDNKIEAEAWLDED